MRAHSSREAIVSDLAFYEAEYEATLPRFSGDWRERYEATVALSAILPRRALCRDNLTVWDGLCGGLPSIHRKLAEAVAQLRAYEAGTDPVSFGHINGQRRVVKFHEKTAEYKRVEALCRTLKDFGQDTNSTITDYQNWQALCWDLPPDVYDPEIGMALAREAAEWK